MEYFTIDADTYEKCVRDAERKYGNRVRIHSRRDYTVGGGLFAKKRKRCEILCYLAPERGGDANAGDGVSRQELKEFEREAKTPDPMTLTEEERHETVLTEKPDPRKAEMLHLLDENEIKGPLREHITSMYKPGEKEDMKLLLSDWIISSVSLDHETQAHPRKYMIFLGPTGSGKTTTLAKVASLYKNVGKNVAVITLDSYRVGAYEQTKAYGDAFGIPVKCVKDEDEVLLACDDFRDYDLVLVDTMGVSPTDGPLNLKLKGLLSLFRESETSYVLTCAANLKSEDLMKQYRHYRSFKITSLIVTKLDETESIGSFLSFCYETGRPLMFCTNGQKVPSDIKKASTTVVLEYLSGFGIDMNRLAAQLS